MSKRHLTVIASALLLAALAVVFLALRGSTRAQAQSADDPPFSEGEAEPVTETAEPNPTIEPGPPQHDPFSLYPADEGAVTWDDMTPEEQAGAEAMQEWAETANGSDVHNAFAAASARTSNLRQLEAAQTASGLDGIETLGVVP